MKGSPPQAYGRQWGTRAGEHMAEKNAKIDKDPVNCYPLGGGRVCDKLYEFGTSVDTSLLQCNVEGGGGGTKMENDHTGEAV